MLRQLFAAAISEVRGQELIERRSRIEEDAWSAETPAGRISWDIPKTGRIFVIGAGKAVASLAKGLEAQLGDRIHAGIIVTKYGHSERLQRIEQLEAGHPVPDEQGWTATRRMLALLEDLTADDRVFVLLTGGASALMVAPTPEIALADKTAVTELLLRSKASIEEINQVRQALSLVKGGGLLDFIAPAQSMTLMISDVPGDDLRLIASGPTVRTLPDGRGVLDIFARHGIAEKIPPAVKNRLEMLSTREQPVPPVSFPRAEHVLLGNCQAIVAAVERMASRFGIPVQHVDVQMRGHTHMAAQHFVAAMKAHARQLGHGPRLFVSAGETTLEVRGRGLGGRNQEFALVGAMELADSPNCFLLASGTDGSDGPTDATGAFADGSTCARAAAAGINIDCTLADNDSYNLFRAIGDLHLTGPTGTNVMDLVLGLVL